MGTNGSADADFGELLQRHRLAAGLTQEALAERAGLSVRGVSDLERGARTAPQRETLRLLADALDLTGAARAAFAGRHPPRTATARAAPPRPEVSHQPRVPLPAPPMLEAPLVGRAAEFTKLVELYHAASRGRPQAVVLQGEAGIGKTRLATEFL